MRGATRVLALTTAAVLPLAVTGCGDDDAAAAGDGPLAVVASTNVWASVVEAVGGDLVDVTALISNPAADPHSYESTASDVATIREADLVVFNGGGYEPFVEDAIETGDQRVVEAFEGEGHSHEEDGAPSGEPAPDETHAAEEDGHEHSEENEHVWYELPAVIEVAEHVAEELGELRPDDAETFTANAERFHEQIEGLEGRLDLLRQTHGGKRVAVTEPVAFYLIEDAGLDDVTPTEFTEAVEEESDPPAGAVAETRGLVSGRQVVVLIFNPQTATPVIESVRDDARAAGIPVVEMTETLPPDTDYVTWMTAQIDALQAALG